MDLPLNVMYQTFVCDSLIKPCIFYVIFCYFLVTLSVNTSLLACRVGFES